MSSITEEIRRDVAIEMARETLADLAARTVITSGNRIYDPDADLATWHAAMLGRLESDMRRLLAEVEASVPGLAEHTAAAQEKIIEAADLTGNPLRGLIEAFDAEKSRIESEWVTAAACDTITKAAQ